MIFAINIGQLSYHLYSIVFIIVKNILFYEVGTECLCIIIQTLEYNMLNTLAKARHRYLR